MVFAFRKGERYPFDQGFLLVDEVHGCDLLC